MQNLIFTFSFLNCEANFKFTLLFFKHFIRNIHLLYKIIPTLIITIVVRGEQNSSNTIWMLGEYFILFEQTPKVDFKVIQNQTCVRIFGRCPINYILLILRYSMMRESLSRVAVWRVIVANLGKSNKPFENNYFSYDG